MQPHFRKRKKYSWSTDAYINARSRSAALLLLMMAAKYEDAV
jgi:hypothetical protein